MHDSPARRAGLSHSRPTRPMTTRAPLILAIESSCDETAVALYSKDDGILANEVYSQIELHRQHGGVVPELAARDHLRRLPPVLQQALERAGKTLQDVELIAYTAGPGLLGALMTGAGYARALAYALGVPAIAIHHMEGHLLSRNPKCRLSPCSFPAAIPN